MTGRLRLGVGALGLMVALLAIFPAPTTLLWMLAIGVTEWGYLAAPLPLLLFLPGWRSTRFGRIGAGLGLAASVLLLVTPLRACQVARALPDRLAAAFGASSPRLTGDASPRPAPLVAADLVRGVASPPVQKSSRIYSTVEGDPLSLDLYAPRTAQGPAPGVIVIHGGGWQNGDSGELPGLDVYPLHRPAQPADPSDPRRARRVGFLRAERAA
ncbi:MAG TPA: hypothetical protein VLY20_08795 [Nitrospiria bacterium]|nr:hypothetical protein [Nitrospiria bacterium]